MSEVKEENESPYFKIIGADDEIFATGEMRDTGFHVYQFGGEIIVPTIDHARLVDSVKDILPIDKAEFRKHRLDFARSTNVMMARVRNPRPEQSEV